MLANSQKTYGLVAQCLHWATAILVLCLIPLGIYMHELPVDTAAEAAHKSWFYSLHKTLGVTVLLLAIVRIGWALCQSRPVPLHAERRLENLAAQTVHWSLYGAIVVMPLSGWLHHSALDGFAPIWWPLPQDLPLIPKNQQLASVFGALHFYTAVLLGLCLTLHIGGALKHLFIDHDATLARMIPFRRIDVPDDLPESQRQGLAPALALLAFLCVGGATLAGTISVWKDGPPASGAMSRSTSGEASWLVDGQNSRLGVQIIQNGSPVQGEFRDWQADINFDPDDLASARVSVAINPSSLSIGAVTEQALAPDFLNVEQYPQAQFQAEEFVKTGVETYEALGLLQLAGHSKPVTVLFSLQIDDGKALVEGTVVINRLDFDIGRQGFSTDKMLGFEVEVLVSIEAEKQPPE